MCVCVCGVFIEKCTKRRLEICVEIVDFEAELISSRAEVITVSAHCVCTVIREGHKEGERGRGDERGGINCDLCVYAVAPVAVFCFA